jgi:hypothetical protein
MPPLDMAFVNADFQTMFKLIEAGAKPLINPELYDRLKCQPGHIAVANLYEQLKHHLQMLESCHDLE